MARRSTSRRMKRLPRPDAAMRRYGGATGVIIALILAVVIILDQRGAFLAPESDGAVYNNARITLVRVIDGDTFELGIADPREGKPTTRVRLIGVDTPEMPLQGRPAEPFALEAKAFAEALAQGKEVTLRVEPERTRDRYGRLLAHIWIGEDGREISLADRLLEEGLARAEDRWPHRDLDRHARLERDARRAEVGIWAR